MSKLALLLLLVPSLALAHPCGKAHKPGPKPCVQKSVWDQGVSNLELVSGFRWQNELECPTLQQPHPVPETKDPFYVGAGTWLPLSKQVSLHGEFDRDFTEAPEYQVRTWVAWRPFK